MHKLMKSHWLVLCISYLCVVAATQTISSCRGDKNAEPAPPNTAPVANAGANKAVIKGTLVTLDGSGSSDVDGDQLTYSWSVTSVPPGSTAALSSTTDSKPTFTADMLGSYVFSLIVNDSKVDSNAASVTVTAVNTAPVANAGANKAVIKGTLVTLDGSGSSDVDGDQLTYSWSVTSVPPGSTAALSSTTDSKPTFTADMLGSYVFSLIVNDSKVDSNAASVTVTAVLAQVAPVANAGANQGVTTGSQVTLDGSGSSDVNSDPLTYRWTIIAIPADSTVLLAAPTTMNPSFVPDKEGSYTFSLVVNDGYVDSPAALVTVKAAAMPVVTGKIPDTGQSKCYAIQATVDCAGTGQDGAYAINPPSYTDNGDGTIKDNVTGLLWQKTTGAALLTWTDADRYCKNNLSVLPGGSWRLPSRTELKYILNINFRANINSAYFIQTNPFNLFWTPTIVVNTAGLIWVVDSLWGIDITSATAGSVVNNVRCVRGQHLSSTYTDNNDGTTTDNTTGLMWQTQDDGIGRIWTDALTYCEGLTLASYTDWRLPNANELSSLIDDSRYSPAIDPLFMNTKTSSPYWSSTYSAWETGDARPWSVTFNSGQQTNLVLINYNGYVRCVRGQ